MAKGQDARGEVALLSEPSRQSSANRALISELQQYWERSPGSVITKLQNFPKYVRREDLTKFLFRHELFRRQLSVHGSVVDLGVARGASLMTWFHLSSIYEPVNYTREIIGFDTFAGIPQIDERDLSGDRVSENVRVGGFAVEETASGDIGEAVRIHDQTRFLGHIPKVRLVGGDIEHTLPAYLARNTHLVVSLLNIDVDVYRPTRAALKLLVPRMPRGAVIVFDELAVDLFPGETVALHEVCGIRNCRLQRLEFAPAGGFMVLE